MSYSAFIYVTHHGDLDMLNCDINSNNAKISCNVSLSINFLHFVVPNVNGLASPRTICCGLVALVMNAVEFILF